MRQKITLIIVACFLTAVALPTLAVAETTTTDATDQAMVLVETEEIVKAEVIKIKSEEIRSLPGTDAKATLQTIEAKILSGSKIGHTVTVANDFLQLKIGDKFFARHQISTDQTETFVVTDPYRLNILWWLGGLFVISILALGGRQGLQSLASLIGSLLVIIYVLIPLLLKGYSPILVSSLVAAGILFLAIFITHGRNKESAVAFAGTFSAVLLTTLLAFVATGLAKLTGFGSDEAIYLNFNTGGTLNFAGLLLGGIIIGTLGVLDDIAITQTAVVSELLHTDHNLTKKEIYRKALRVGREHVGALVNTLALAYTGASLPMVMLLSQSTLPLEVILNSENFATEIIRTVVGSIGLILTVPITTALAVMYLSKNDPVKHGGHTHHHH